MDYDLKWNKALEFGGVAVAEDVKKSWSWKQLKNNCF